MTAAAPSLVARDDSPEPTVGRRLGRGLAIIALLSALALAWPMFSDIPLALDEHGSYWIIQPDDGVSIWERCQRIVATPPLGSWLQAISIELCGRSEWALRLPLTLAYLAAIAWMYFLGRDFDRPVTGGLAALLLAWSPQVVDEVLIGRFYALVLLLSVALLHVTMRWRRSLTGWRWSLAWGIVAAGLVWSHYVTVPFLGLCWLGAAWPDRPARRSVAVQALQSLTAAAITTVLSWPLTPAVLRLSQWSRFLDGFAQPVPWLELVTPLWWLGCPAGLAVAWLATCRRPTDAANLPPAGRWCEILVLCLLAFGLVLAGAAAQAVGLPSLANPRYRISATVPGALLLAALLLRHGAIGGFAGAIVASAAAWSATGHSPFDPPRLDNPMDHAWRDMARVVAREARAGEPVFVQCGLVEASLLPAYFEDAEFSAYVACGMSRFYLPAEHPRYALPFDWRGPATMIARYRERIRTAPSGRVWLAAAADTDLNQASIAGFEALAQRAGLVVQSERRFAHGRLLLFERRP